MQSISINNLFMCEHEKWRGQAMEGASIIVCPPIRKSEGAIVPFAPAVPRSMVSAKVADTNHLDMSRCLRQSPWQVRDKPVCVALMEFSTILATEVAKIWWATSLSVARPRRVDYTWLKVAFIYPAGCFRGLNQVSLRQSPRCKKYSVHFELKSHFW